MSNALLLSKALCAAVLLLYAPVLTAHDLQTRAEVDGRFVVFQASFEGSEAASFVAVEVHAPTEEAASADAYQTGRTDTEGRFVFLPDRPGLWRIVVDDEMGHRATQEIAVADVTGQTGGSGPAVPAGRGSVDRLVIGLSVIFGITGLLVAFLQRRKAMERI